MIPTLRAPKERKLPMICAATAGWVFEFFDRWIAGHEAALMFV